MAEDIMRETPEGEERMTLRMPASLKADFEALAKRNRRTLTGEILVAMERHLVRCSAREGGAREE
jgi:hypothetical protein